MSDTQKAKTEKYKLLSGKHSGFDKDGARRIFNAGEWLELTQEQAKSFGNKIKSERVLKAEQAAYAAYDEKTDASDKMTPTREQPLAPLEPVEDGTNTLEDDKASEALQKQTTLPTDQNKPIDGVVQGTQEKPVTPGTPATAAPVKPGSATK